MNLKGLKKVHEDDHVALFRSKDGHECRISKRGLSEKLRKELADLPIHASKGADVQPEEFEPGKDYSKSPLPGDSVASEDSSIEKMAPPKEGAAHQVGKLIKKYGIDPVVQGVKDTAGAVDTIYETGKDVARGAGILPEEKPQMELSSVARPAQQEQPIQQPAPQPEQVMPQAPAIPPPAAPRPVASQQVKTPEQVYSEEKQKHDTEANAVFHDLVVGNLKPQTYGQLLYGGKDFFGKMGSLFGLLMSGAGSGLSKQPNLLMEMMNKEIDRDLEAQKESSKNAQNLYKLNIDKALAESRMTKEQAEAAGIWKDVEQKALQNSRTQMELFAMHHLMQQSNLLPSSSKPVAQQALSGVQGAVAQSIDKRNSEAAQNEALRTMGQLGLLPGAERVAESREARTVPGVGTSSQVVPADVRGQLATYQRLNDSVDDLLQYSKKHNNILPAGPAYEEGRTKALAVQQMVREGLLGTVFRDSEKPLLEKFVRENPAGVFKSIATQPRLRAILESNRISSNALKKSYGLPVSESKSSAGEIRYDAQGNAWKLGSDGKPVRVK